MAVRCFIAIELPGEIKAKLGELTSVLRKTGADVKWVQESNHHLTLKFLGATDEELIPAIREALERNLSLLPPFYIKISGVGHFPGGRHPRVVWVGIGNSEALSALQRDIEAEMTKLGYPAEERPFSPHLTLGRVKSPRGTRELLGRLEEFRQTEVGELEVKGVSLMKSELRPAGAEYSPLAQILFGGRNDDE
jgi:2'-5' RNA ligase